VYCLLIVVQLIVSLLSLYDDDDALHRCFVYIVENIAV